MGQCALMVRPSTEGKNTALPLGIRGGRSPETLGALYRWIVCPEKYLCFQVPE